MAVLALDKYTRGWKNAHYVKRQRSKLERKTVRRQLKEDYDNVHAKPARFTKGWAS